MTAAETLPLFPLSALVLPEGRMPLRIFERRYLDMISGVLKSGTGFGICLIKEGNEAGTPAEPYPAGTVVNIVDFDQGDDGLLHITVEGSDEFVIHEVHTRDDGLLMGDIERIPAQTPTSVDIPFTDLSAKLALMLDAVQSHIQYDQRKLDDPAWVSSRLLELLPIEPAHKYSLISLRSVEQRLSALLELDIQIAQVKAD